jgi:serine/threonine protein kinase
MQYVAGTDAEAALQAEIMTATRAIRIVSEVAKALDYAHQRNVVHHDVKPGNVLLSNGAHGDVHVLLSDFGVARATGNPHNPEDVSTLAATLAYAAPEVLTGGHVDGRADVYSLGCTLFRLLTGRQPYFAAEGTTAIAIAHLHQTPPRFSDYRPGSSPRLDAVMAKALAKNPAERFDSAREFARAAGDALRVSPAAPNDVSRAIDAPSDISPRRSAGQPAAAGLPAERAWPLAGVARTHDVNRLGRITITPAPPRRQVPKRVVVIGAAAAAVIAPSGIALWMLWPEPSAPEVASPSPTTTATTPSDSSAEPRARFSGLLPAGYPPGTCKPARVPDGATAAMACGPNTDPEGPTSATYTLARDLTTLRSTGTWTDY